jgi:hypothetical protein
MANTQDVTVRYTLHIDFWGLRDKCDSLGLVVFIRVVNIDLIIILVVVIEMKQSFHNGDKVCN